MEKKLPNSTKVVVIGGGVVGCSVAYHLAKLLLMLWFEYPFINRNEKNIIII